MKQFTEIKFIGNSEQVNRQWHEERNNGIGGSDVSILMGINEYRTPLDLWLEKTGRKQPDDISGKPAIIVGNALEDVVRDWFKEQHPELIIREPKAMYRSIERPWAQASLDGVCHVKGKRRDDESSYFVLECKTVGEYRSSDWDNGVPDYYLTQVTHYLSVTGWNRAYVAVLIGNREFREYTIERDEEDIKAVNKAVDDFWKFVKNDTMPELQGNDVDEVFPQDNGEDVYTDDSRFDEMVKKYRELSEQESQCKKQKQLIAEKLKLFIGENKKIHSEQYTVTYRTQHYKEHLVKESDRRVLTTSKVKD
jgi:putative phage-type endonuclease